VGDRHYPLMEINLDAIQNNARVLCDLCAATGISVAGVIKFSDGDPRVARAYAAGGCAQIAVSRASHLRQVKEAVPDKELLLTRSPTQGDLTDTARYADLGLYADADLLEALDRAAEREGTRPGVILMLDVGDLREGVPDIRELVSLAMLCEKLPYLRLRGVGASHACLNGVLPTPENLAFLIEGAEAVERAIGRRLEIISGGSSINLRLLQSGVNQMPPRINHLRLGGTIANPMNIRLGRGLTFPGLREDSVMLTAEIIEIHVKDSAPKSSTKNWAGQTITRVDKGRRLRAILALGSQDVGDACTMIPLESGAEIVGCSSDHTVVDLTDTSKTWRSGDTLTFSLRYSNMLCAFTGRHVGIDYRRDSTV